jgi:hypothetical protein
MPTTEELTQARRQTERMLEGVTQPYWRVFAEIGTWIRLQELQRSTGLSKVEVAAIANYRDTQAVMISLLVLSLGVTENALKHKPVTFNSLRESFGL